MNKPFFKSNLIDLQELDNKIYSLINKKLNGKLTTELKNAEVQYKNILKEKEEVEKVLEPYLSELKVIETKEIDIKNKITSIDQKLNNQNLNSDELSNYGKQKENNENILLQIYESQENLKSKFLVEIDQLETINFQLEDKKNELIKLSKLTQDEWKNIDQKLSLLEDDKKKFINTLPKEIVQLYDDLKSKGVEVIAGYKREGQCGCCGVSLTSSELDNIDDSEFNQCPYCQGVQV